MTDEEKARELYSRYRYREKLVENGRVLYDDILGFPNANKVCRICPEAKVENRVGLAPQESEFRDICALGPELMCLCYARSARQGAYSYFTADAMRVMCKDCKNYLPRKNEGKPYDPENFRNDFSIFKPYFIVNAYGGKIWEPEVDSGDPPAYVYYITDGEYVKVGFATDPYKRLRGIQTGNPRVCEIMWLIPFKTERDAHKAEQDLHWIYATYRRAGEWFDILDKLDKRRFLAEFYSA